MRIYNGMRIHWQRRNLKLPWETLGLPKHSFAHLSHCSLVTKAEAIVQLQELQSAYMGKAQASKGFDTSKKRKISVLRRCAQPRTLKAGKYRRTPEVHQRGSSTYLGGVALPNFSSSPALTRKTLRKPHPTDIGRATPLNYNVCCRSLVLSRLAFCVTSIGTNSRSETGSTSPASCFIFKSC